MWLQSFCSSSPPCREGGGRIFGVRAWNTRAPVHLSRGADWRAIWEEEEREWKTPFYTSRSGWGSSKEMDRPMELDQVLLPPGGGEGEGGRPSPPGQLERRGGEEGDAPSLRTHTLRSKFRVAFVCVLRSSRMKCCCCCCRCRVALRRRLLFRFCTIEGVIIRRHGRKEWAGLREWGERGEGACGGPRQKLISALLVTGTVEKKGRKKRQAS